MGFQRTLIFFIFTLFLASGCAYRWGHGERALPGGYDHVAIPMFKNQTTEVGIEADFTNAIINEFHRSRVAQVTDKIKAPVVLEGIIESVEYTGRGASTNEEIVFLPEQAVLNTRYQIVVQVLFRLRRVSDRRLVWESRFRSEKSYPAPQIGSNAINSANATYNQSAKLLELKLIAKDLMAEAHNRIVEKF